MVNKLFPYSGSKQWVLQHLPTLPDYDRVVECYAGSMAFSINQKKPFIGYDMEPKLVWIYDFLKRLGTKEQFEIDNVLSYIDDVRVSLAGKNICTEFTEKGYWFVNDEHLPHNEVPGFDTAEVIFVRGIFALIRLCCAGLYVGAFSSKKIYPQHKVPIDKIRETLIFLKGVEWDVFYQDSALYEPKKGDLVFLDPPYLRTIAGYKVDKNFSITHTENIINRCKMNNVPFIVTYGTGAREDLPGLAFTCVSTKTTSNIRKSGTNTREENVHISWLHG